MKHADGNLCKNCADKLSLPIDDHRQSTVEEIRNQLASWKENAPRPVDIHLTTVYGISRKIYVDEDDRIFL